MHGCSDDFRMRHGDRIQRCSSPGHIHRKSGEVNDAAVAAVTTEVMGCPHENAVDRTRLNTQSAKHAFRIVDRVSSNFESLPSFHAFLANIDAVNRARLRALVTGNASGQVKPVKAAIPRSNGNGFFGILELLRKRSPAFTIRSQPVSQRDEHAFTDRRHGNCNIAKPIDHLTVTSSIRRCRSTCRVRWNDAWSAPALTDSCRAPAKPDSCDSRFAVTASRWGDASLLRMIAAPTLGVTL